MAKNIMSQYLRYMWWWICWQPSLLQGLMFILFLICYLSVSTNYLLCHWVNNLGIQMNVWCFPEFFFSEIVFYAQQYHQLVLYKEQMFLKLLWQWGKISDEVRSSIFSKFINKCQCTCLAHLKIKPKQRCFDLILSILEVHHKSSTGLCLAFWMVKRIKNSLKYLSFRTKVYDQQI